MGEKKGAKTKMAFVTFIGLFVIAGGIKAVRIIKDKMEKRKQNDNHEDCCG